MNLRPNLRPGGRSARVQAAVHRATNELAEEIGRAQLTVPLIAARAGVTPSTVYRRWGDLAELLADVALDRFRAETEPVDSGSVEGDLQAWAEQFFEEMGSEVGQTMLRDVLAGRIQGSMAVPSQCAAYTASQIEIIITRGLARGEAVPTVEAIMDGVVAPIIYRTLFGPARASHALVRGLVAGCMAGAGRPGAQRSDAAVALDGLAGPMLE
ncbi:TetR/AcrR family transcriptional regulator [Acidovorax sp.]|jgi:AcrR family transcriptional regulator|uniref:TetR/AcrR family transcriptional regulator n=1 Tax=Acidovorax sp. TaxID=1872122 RepID=UPI00391F2C82